MAVSTREDRLSTSIDKSRAGTITAPQRAASVKAPPPPPAVKSALAGDRLGLSPQLRQLESLKLLLESPLPPAPPLPKNADWSTLDRAGRTALIQTLRQDEAVMTGLRTWQKLPQDMRLQLGARISAIQGQSYGFQPRALSFEDGPYRGGFQAGKGPITIGPKSMVSASEFLNTVVHEQTHALQWEKGDALSRKKLPPGDPYAAMAMTWYDNFFDYHVPSKGVRAYRDQPVERHAFATGDEVSKAVLPKP